MTSGGPGAGGRGGGGVRGDGWPAPPGGWLQPPARLTPFQEAVVAVVRALPAGEVVTYAEVALEAGHPGAAQAVANVLRRVPGLPWWRVVPTSGRLYRTHTPVQQPLLGAEGVEVDGERWVIG
ncbi:MAG: MGMT family protein [Actinomycetes bacterium]